MKRAIFITILFSLAASVAFSAPIFDFGTTTRTFISGPDSTPPDSGDFIGGAPFTETKFLVGNLTKGCGLFPPRGTRSESGTNCSFTGAADRINYDTGADDFTLSEDTEGILEVIVKLGHPEVGAPPAHRMQDQLEQFDILLTSSGGDILFAEFLDDVSKADFGDEDNGYYRYLYAPVTIPAGTYSPSFVARDGSIEFLTTFRVRPDERVPEPGTLLLLAAGLGLARASRRKRTSLS